MIIQNGIKNNVTNPVCVMALSQEHKPEGKPDKEAKGPRIITWNLL